MTLPSVSIGHGLKRKGREEDMEGEDPPVGESKRQWGVDRLLLSKCLSGS